MSDCVKQKIIISNGESKIDDNVFQINMIYCCFVNEVDSIGFPTKNFGMHNDCGLYLHSLDDIDKFNKIMEYEPSIKSDITPDFVWIKYEDGKNHKVPKIVETYALKCNMSNSYKCCMDFRQCHLLKNRNKKIFVRLDEITDKGLYKFSFIRRESTQNQ